jgi:hypothetical protein
MEVVEWRLFSHVILHVKLYSYVRYTHFISTTFLLLFFFFSSSFHHNCW